MKVAIDPWTLSPRFRHQGTYVYAWKLLSEFQRLATTRTELDFCLFTTPHGGNDANHFAESTGFKLKASSFLDYHRLWRLGLNSIAARRSRADVLFAPTVSAVPIGQVPVVTTIHDATPVVMPSHSLAGNSWLRMLLWSAARFSTFIITDSECSRQDLIRICGVPESRIAMVYLGFDNALFNDKDAPAPESAAVLKRMGVNRPYIMHHGTIQPRKNLARLIKAFDLMLSTNKDLEVDLVLPGKVGWEHGEIFELSRRWSHE